MDVVKNMGLDVMRFQDEVLGLPRPTSPQMLTGDRLQYANVHLHEELRELLTAETIEDQVDALLDMTYVALGRLLEMGIPVSSWDEVQRANMDRRGAGKTSRSDYDAVKPMGWMPPDLSLYCSVTRSELDAIAAMRDGCMVLETPYGEYRLAPAEPDRGQYIGLTRAAAGHRPHPKLLILGHGRHGKDTVAELLRDRYGLSFTSSSWFCAEHVVMPYTDRRYAKVYASVQECYDDRHNGHSISGDPGKPNRAVWYDAITEYNRPDASALGRAIWARHDICCGLRSAREMAAVKAAGLYDLCVWVDASGRGVPAEDRSSITVEPWMADHVLDNSGDLAELTLNVDRLMKSQFNMEPRQ